MIKGVNKCVIEVAETGNKYFERAILFVRPEFAEKSPDLMKEKAKKYLLCVGDISGSYHATYKSSRTKKRVKILIGLSILVFSTILLYLLFK